MCRRIALELHQILLVLGAVGMEAGIMLETFLMIANLQTLGVPTVMVSLPATFSGIFSAISIIALGYFVDKVASSTAAKAKVLVVVASIEQCGLALILTANALKLYTGGEGVNETEHEVRPQSPQSGFWNNFSEFEATQENHSALNLQPLSQNTISSVLQYLNDSAVPYFDFAGGRGKRGGGEAEGVDGDEGDSSSLPYYAMLGMAGYAILDCGYDSSSCFLKTFTLACSPASEHSKIIVKNVLVSSFGGCLIAILGTFGVGTGFPFGGLDLDKNASQATFLSALSCFLLFLGMALTLLTGFCCPPMGSVSRDDAVERLPTSFDEKSLLTGTVPKCHSYSITSSISFDDAVTDVETHHTTPTVSSMAPPIVPPMAPPTTVYQSISDSILPKDSLTRKISFISTKSKQDETSPKSGNLTRPVGWCERLKRKKQLIYINAGTFFLMGALYAFEIYSTNFIGVCVYQGDPHANSDSEPYENYLKGVQSGGAGCLLYYVAFSLTNIAMHALLSRLGWKRVVVCVCLMSITLTLLCALLNHLWIFFIASAWLGVYRSAMTTVPYILANQLADKESQGTKQVGLSFASVAAMLPAGFTLCAAVVGPLVDVTGSSATPIFYTSINVAIGLIFFLLVKV